MTKKSTKEKSQIVALNCILKCFLFPFFYSDTHECSVPAHQNPQLILKMDGRRLEEVLRPKDDFSTNGSVISLISDDEDDGVYVLKDHKAEISINHECIQLPRKERGEAAMENGRQGNGFCINDDITQFRGENVDAAQQIDVLQAVSGTPFCLYLYVGVQLGEERSTREQSFVLIGYFDQSSGVRVLRHFHTLQMKVATLDSQNSVDTDVITRTADSDISLLIKALKKCNLPLSNLAMFYCAAPHPVVNKVFVSHLQTLNSNLISLCSIPGIAGRACDAGLKASFSDIVDLVKDIHRHYSTLPSVNDCLKELFVNAKSFNPSLPISLECLFIIHTVQKMVHCWQELLEYFKSLQQTKDTSRIRIRLMDNKVQLHFLFLSFALEPLRALQDFQLSVTADLAVELQLISMLVHSYAASILQPSVRERFLKKRDIHLLHRTTELLPLAEVNIGSRARDFMVANIVDLGEQNKTCFLRKAQSFYKSALQSLADSIPEQFGDVTLRNIEVLLKDPEKITVRILISVVSVWIINYTSGHHFSQT